MRFEDEPYVRVYTRNTPTLKLVGWRGRAVLWELTRAVDRAGLLDVGDDAVEAVVAATDLPEEVVRPGLEALLKRKVVEVNGAVLLLPRFIEAQTAKQSDRARKAKEREMARAVAKALTVGTNVTPRDSPSEIRTKSHSQSQTVTLSIAEQSEASQNTHNAGARAKVNSGKPNDGQEAFKRPTVQPSGAPAVQATKGPARPASGPAIDTSSPEAEAILQAMREHKALAEATGPVADALWGLVMTKAVKLEWVLASVHAAGDEADLALADGKPFAWDYIRNRLRIFVSATKQPGAAGRGGYKRRPDEIKQGAWSISEAERKRVEEQDAARPKMTEAEIEEALVGMPAEEAENLRRALRAAS